MSLNLDETFYHTRAGIYSSPADTNSILPIVYGDLTDGTSGNLHTINFDPAIALKLFERVSPLGSLIKGHYTDWVANPQEYPLSGMGGANVGPEFTFIELEDLYTLGDEENILLSRQPSLTPSHFREAIKTAVLESHRWEKWLLPDEAGLSFDSLAQDRQEWLIGTGARYVWTNPRVLSARRQLYSNLVSQDSDPHHKIIDRIAQNMQKYIDAFNLGDSSLILT